MFFAIFAKLMKSGIERLQGRNHDFAKWGLLKTEKFYDVVLVTFFK